jgi:hypothetical protein
MDKLFALGHVYTGTKILELAPYEISVRPICIGGGSGWSAEIPRGEIRRSSSTSVIEESISLDRCDQVQALNNIAAVELI